MKLSKTGIKELTARYRNVLLKGIAIVAIMATSSVATAADVVVTGAEVYGGADSAATVTDVKTEVTTKADGEALAARTNANTTAITTNTGNIAQNTSAINEINNSAVMTSGIDATKVGQIATNTAAIATKQNAITEGSKLSADLVDDSSSTNKFVTAAEKAQIETNKNAIATKQNAITEDSKLSADLVDDSSSTNKFVTAAEKAQIETNKGDIATNAAAIQANTAAIATKQNAITEGSKLSADLVDDSSSTNKFVTAAEKAQIATNKTNISSLDAKVDNAESEITSLGNRVSQVESGVSTLSGRVDGTEAGITSLGNRVGLVETDIATKQNAITEDSKLSADLVDDSSSTNKFVTAAEKTQIETNKGDIATNKNAIETINNSDVMKSGIDATKVAQIATNKTNIQSNKDAIDVLNGSGEGSVSKSISDAVNALDSTKSQTAGVDGLALEIVQENGKITSISGSIAAETYDDYGAADAAKTAVENKLGAGAGGYDINAKSLQVQGVDVVTTSGAQTLTNKTIDADSNTISNLETDNFKTGVVASGNIASGATDKLASTDAVVKSIAAQAENATFTASGNIEATTLKTAIQELDTEKAGLAEDNTFTGKNTFKNDAGVKIQNTDGDKTTSLTATTDGLNVSTGMKVNGNETVTGNETVGGTLNVTGKTSLSTLSTSGEAELNSLKVTTNATISGNETVTGNETVGGTLSVTGNTSLSTLSTSGLATLNSLTVNNASNLKGTLDVTGATTLKDTLTVAKKTTLSAADGLAFGDGPTVKAINTGDSYVDTTDALTLATMASLKAQAENATFTPAGTAKNVAGATTLNGAITDLDKAIGDRTITSANTAVNTALATDVASAVKTIGDEIGTQAYVNNKTVSYDAIAANTNLTDAVSQVASNIGSAASAANGNITATNTVNANLDQLDSAIGNRSEFGATGSNTIEGSDVVTAVNDVDTALVNTQTALGSIINQEGDAYNGSVLSADGFVADKADLTTSLTDYAANVEKATGGAFDATGAWTATVNNGTTNNYVYTATDNLMGAINQVAGNVGTAEQLGTAVNEVSSNNTVNQNIAAVNATIGDMDTLQAKVADTTSDEFKRGNLTNGSTEPVTDLTVAKAISNIDQTMGQIHGLRTKLAGESGETSTSAGSNLAEGTTVEDHLTSLDKAIGNRTAIGSANQEINAGTALSVSQGLYATGNAIGDLQYSSHRYVRQGSNLTNAISDLDTGLSNLEDRVHKYHKETKAGFASVAALSALVPNARSSGDTQVSIGTGYHRGETGLAIGGFHYLNDNTLFNLGAAYAGDASATFRGGVTFGF